MLLRINKMMRKVGYDGSINDSAVLVTGGYKMAAKKKATKKKTAKKAKKKAAKKTTRKKK